MARRCGGNAMDPCSQAEKRAPARVRASTLPCIRT
jgi:hypothetical protein